MKIHNLKLEKHVSENKIHRDLVPTLGRFTDIFSKPIFFSMKTLCSKNLSDKSEIAVSSFTKQPRATTREAGPRATFIPVYKFNTQNLAI